MLATLFRYNSNSCWRGVETTTSDSVDEASAVIDFLKPRVAGHWPALMLLRLRSCPNADTEPLPRVAQAISQKKWWQQRILAAIKVPRAHARSKRAKRLAGRYRPKNNKIHCS